MGPMSSSTRLRLVGRPYRPFKTSSDCSLFNSILKLRLGFDEGEWVSEVVFRSVVKGYKKSEERHKGFQSLGPSR